MSMILIDEAVERLQREFGVSKRVARKMVLKFIKEGAGPEHARSLHPDGTSVSIAGKDLVFTDRPNSLTLKQ